MEIILIIRNNLKKQISEQIFRLCRIIGKRYSCKCFPVFLFLMENRELKN